MAAVMVTGASDDNIEVDGDICDEFQGGDETAYLAFSDGTVLSVRYTDEGLWRINRIRGGSAAYEHQDAEDPDGVYTDKVTLTGDLTWVVCGRGFQKAKP